MGRDFNIALEYDGENPIRNTFLCVIDDFPYNITLRDWEDLYDNDLIKHSDKKHSLKTLELSKSFGCFSWDINKFDNKIEAIKKEIELDIELDEKDKIKLNNVIKVLKELKDVVVQKCNEKNISFEKCYINWWIDY